MALHESALEEFGLSPLWVRRGIARTTVAASDAATEVEALSADQAVDTTVSAPAAAAARDTLRETLRPAANPQPAPASSAGTAAVGQPAMRQSVDRETPAATPRGAVRPADTNNAPRPVTRSEAPQQSADAPDFDDMAWFDDLPSEPPGEARKDGDSAGVPSIATLDWDALSARVASCERCRLCEKRTNTVFGVGDRNADWMLIGEAPGENEDRQGEPFVGQAGKLLDNMLRSLTLARGTNVYIANVIKCRPPGNRNPEPDEVARCEPYLQRQVSLVKPKLIVALGRFAAQSLLKTDASISSLRGRVHEYEGVPVIVTYHPAYLLRSLPDKAKAWADLCLARDTWRKAAGAPAS
ncbi:MAG TPA: uracil-DNA glycosylase [Paraburkholderia sp.]|nr:uracil-DNA glycosylase [Paraburkholderia sp.]